MINSSHQRKASLRKVKQILERLLRQPSKSSDCDSIGKSFSSQSGSPSTSSRIDQNLKPSGAISTNNFAKIRHFFSLLSSFLTYSSQIAH